MTQVVGGILVVAARRPRQQSYKDADRHSSSCQHGRIVARTRGAPPSATMCRVIDTVTGATSTIDDAVPPGFKVIAAR